uniref:S phase cyclin A-associated protein in the endoplasmic reticulum N-terminal domain-containing protein n=1 Tax=Globodera rostochiensis TaxID=31243 RepID=A0A914H231_GLORO
MYEICRKQQNFLGCEEAIMFLKNGIRDFLSLIDTIKIEQNWENSEKRPMAPVAWEIRGSISKNNLAPQARNVKEVECQTKFDEDCRANQKEKKEESEWQLVQRKKGAGRSGKNQQNEVNICPFLPVGKQRKAPKSAMDLPQTKASMAKMAYSRQLLFEKHKKTLLEKFNARKRTENREAQSKGKGTAGEPAKTKSSTDLNQIILAEEERKDLEKDGQIVGCLKTLIDRLSDDCEWRAMTEEEESLAQEEESLKKEIEEEEENLPHFVDELVDKDNLKKDDGTVARKGQNEYNNGRVGPINGAEGSSHFRNPGELAQLRAKLLSPTKRRRVEDIDHSSESKLRRAEELRRLLKQEKAQRLNLLHRRVGEERIQKAEEKRQKSLQEIVLKAQEDEMKIIETNLLNSFEAANQRLGKRFTQIRERNRFEKVVLKAEEERQKRIEDNRQQREEAEKRRKHAEEQRAKRLKAQANQGIERQFYAQKHRVKTMEKYRAKLAQHSQKVCQRKESELADKQKLLDKIQRKHEKRTENYEQCKEQSLLGTNQRPINLERVTAAEHGQGEEGVTQTQAMTTSKSCFRCGTKAIFFNDLQLLSHIMSEAHLAKADRKFGSILQSSMFSFDFLKNELEKMTNSDELTEVMTKSTDECSLGRNHETFDDRRDQREK